MTRVSFKSFAQRAIAIGLLCSSLSFAEVKNTPTATYQAEDTSRFQVSVGPSLALLESVVGFGAAAQGLFHLTSSFYVGLELGYYKWSQSVASGSTSLSTSISSIPILAVALYKFKMVSDEFIPYIGVAAGVSLTSGGVTFLGTSFSNSKANFEILAKPGFEFVLSPRISLMLEPKLGILNSSFVFLPNVSVGFSF